jgi:hypothetical protein
MPRRLTTQIEGLWIVGRPGARWGDEVGRDKTMVGIRSRWAAAVKRERGGNV